LKSAQEVEEYLAWCREGGAIPRFKGYFAFRILFGQGRMAASYTTIRAMYTGSIDIAYYVNQDGLLEKVGVQNPPALNPEEVLSEENLPYGWEPEQLRPKQKEFTP
jgi:hypothetical protein